jgi:exosortase family protein XrtF
MKLSISVFKNPVAYFLAKVLLMYIAWYGIYELWLHPRQTVDLFIIDISIKSSKFILETFGYAVFTGSDRLMGIDGVPGLWIGDNCNGLALFALFAGFIIAYPGPWKKKLLYIPIGILLLQALYIIRLVALAIIQTYSLEMTEFNHTYTFTIIIYGFIFLLWMKWVNTYSGNKLTSINKREIKNG